MEVVTPKVFRSVTTVMEPAELNAKIAKGMEKNSILTFIKIELFIGPQIGVYKMAHYENQSDMFGKRAENNKKNGDRYYALAMASKSSGDEEGYNKYMAQAMAQYKMMEDNKNKAKYNKGKSW